MSDGDYCVEDFSLYEDLGYKFAYETANNDVIDLDDAAYAEYREGNVLIFAEDGDDFIRAEVDTFVVSVGGAGNDTLIGHDLFGGEGDDSLTGILYDDHYFTGTAVGGNGNDTISASFVCDEGGNDLINTSSQAQAGAGDDTVTIHVPEGLPGHHYINAGTGNDSIMNVGEIGVDLFGEDGNDTIYSGEAGDLIRGGDGHDLIYAGAGGDTIDSYGDDTIYISDVNDDEIVRVRGFDPNSDFVFIDGISLEDHHAVLTNECKLSIMLDNGAEVLISSDEDLSDLADVTEKCDDGDDGDDDDIWIWLLLGALAAAAMAFGLPGLMSG